MIDMLRMGLLGAVAEMVVAVVRGKLEKSATWYRHPYKN